MGKGEEEQYLPSTSVAAADGAGLENEDANRCCRVNRYVRLKCVFLVILSFGLLLSAVFWLPPFFHYGDRQQDLDLKSPFPGHDIVARFKVQKPFSVLVGNISQLEEDILSEMDYSSIKVVVLALEYSAGSNFTEVVFAVDPVRKDTKLSTTTLSLIRDSVVYMVMEPSYLRLTASLFGNPYAFEVLKFSGGITVIPSKGVYMLQKVQIYFNFTLNFSVSQIQGNFDDLTTQLKSGLHLSAYENLYIRLTNYQGSTVSPPTTVQTSVVMAVGYNPSIPRLKQLAQTITGPHSKNLGLNNTVFGKVKEVRLSSISNGGDSSPSPAPVPQPRHHSPYQGHHQHHYDLAPSPAVYGGKPPRQRGKSTPKIGGSYVPSPAPASHEVKSPSCQNGHKHLPRKAKDSYITPIAAPTISPQISPAPPHPRKDPPRDVSQPVQVSSPLPSVVFSHVHPPSEGRTNEVVPDVPPDIAPSLPHSGTPSTPLLPHPMMLPIFTILAFVLSV